MRTISERCKGRTEIATYWRQQSTWTVSAGIQTAQTDAADVQMVDPQVWSTGGESADFASRLEIPDDLALESV